ncbi:MAG: iron ABC transporter permease [Litorilinea sp.]
MSITTMPERMPETLTAIEMISKSERWRRWWLAMPLLLVLCLALVWFSTAIGVGSVTLTPPQVWRALVAPENATRHEIVASNARLARALMALGVGMALGTAGALLQALYRNPLADPGITGVTQGAVTAAVAWIVFGPVLTPTQVSWMLPAVSALGALLSATLTWSIARLGGRVEPVRLILIGVLVGGVLGAVTSVALLYAGEDTQALITWLSGSLASVTWQKLRLFGAGVLITLPLLLMAIPRANILQFGDDMASGLGQSVTPARAIVLVAACLLTAAAVCTVGGIGFVGLVAPHLLRWFVGSDLRRLVPGAALGGGALVLVADLVARNLRPADIGEWLNIPLNTNAITLPVGVYLALLGGPFFLFLLRRMRS